MAKDLSKLTKKQLEQYGRELGIELDKRLTKAKMVKQIEEFEANQKVKTEADHVSVFNAPELTTEPEVKPKFEVPGNEFIVYLKKGTDVLAIADTLNAELEIEVISKMPTLRTIGIRAKNKDTVLEVVKKKIYSDSIHKVIRNVKISLQEVKPDFKQTPETTILQVSDESKFTSKNWNRVHFRHLERVTSLQQPIHEPVANNISSPTYQMTGGNSTGGVLMGRGTDTFGNQLSADITGDRYAENFIGDVDTNAGNYHTIARRVDFGGIPVTYTNSNGDTTETTLNKIPSDYTLEFRVFGIFTASPVSRLDRQIRFEIETDGKTTIPSAWNIARSQMFGGTENTGVGGHGHFVPNINVNVNVNINEYISSNSSIINIRIPNYTNAKFDFNIYCTVKSSTTTANVNSPLLSSDNPTTGLTRNSESKTNYKGQYSSGTGNITGKGVDVYVIDTGVAGAASGISGNLTDTVTAPSTTPQRIPQNQVRPISIPHRNFLNETFDPSITYSSDDYSERYTQIAGDNINEEIDSPYRVFSIVKTLEDRGITSAASSFMQRWYDEDTQSHGTTVAQCASGYETSLAPDSRVYAVKVFDENGYGIQSTTAMNILSGVEDILTHHQEKINASNSTRPSVVNMSIGFDYRDPENLVGADTYFHRIFLNDTSTAADGGDYGFFDDLHRTMLNAGIHVCYAAGNSSMNTEFVDGTRTGASAPNAEATFDANVSLAIENTEDLNQPKYVVGATEYESGTDRVSTFSNYGAGVNVWAPGTNIVYYSWISTFANVPDEQLKVASRIGANDFVFPFTPTGGDTFPIGSGSGTSFASPIVAGTVAQYLQEYPYGNNGETDATLASVQDTFNFLTNTGTSESNTIDTGDWFDVPYGRDNWENALSVNGLDNMNFRGRSSPSEQLRFITNSFTYLGLDQTFYFMDQNYTGVGYSHLCMIIPEGLTLNAGDWIALQNDPRNGNGFIKYHRYTRDDIVGGRNNADNIYGLFNTPIRIAESNGTIAMLDTHNYITSTLFFDINKDSILNSGPAVDDNTEDGYNAINVKISKLTNTHALRNDSRIFYHQALIDPNGSVISTTDDKKGYFPILAVDEISATENIVGDYFPANTQNKNYLFSPFTEIKTPLTWNNDVYTNVRRDDIVNINVGISDTQLTLWNDETIAVSQLESRLISSPDGNMLPEGLNLDPENLDITGTVSSTAVYGKYIFEIIVWPSYTIRRFEIEITEPNTVIPEIESWTTDLDAKTLTVNLNLEVIPGDTDATKLTILTPDSTFNLTQDIDDSLVNDPTVLSDTLTYALSDTTVSIIQNLVSSIPNTDCLTITPVNLKLRETGSYAINPADNTLISRVISIASAIPVSDAILPSPFNFLNWQVNLNAATATFHFTHTVDPTSITASNLVIADSNNNIVRNLLDTDFTYVSTGSSLAYDEINVNSLNLTAIETAGLPFSYTFNRNSFGSASNAWRQTATYGLSSGNYSIRNSVKGLLSNLVDNNVYYGKNLPNRGDTTEDINNLPFLYLTNGDKIKFQDVQTTRVVLYTDTYDSAADIGLSHTFANNDIQIFGAAPPGLLLTGNDLNINVGDILQTSLGTVDETDPANVVITGGDNMREVATVEVVGNNTNITFVGDDYSGYETTTTIYNNVRIAGKNIKVNLSTDLNDTLHTSYGMNENPNDIQLLATSNPINNACGSPLNLMPGNGAPTSVVYTEMFIPPKPKLTSWTLDSATRTLQLCYDANVNSGTLDLISKEMILNGSNGSIRINGSGSSSTSDNCVEINFTSISFNAILNVIATPTDTNLRLRAEADHITGANGELACSFGDTPGTFNPPADTTPPELQTWDLNLDNLTLTLNFNEIVPSTSILPNELSVTGINGTHRLTSTEVITSAASTARISLTADRDSLINVTQNDDTSIISLSSHGNSFAQDTSMNAIDPINVFEVRNFTPAALDMTPPTLNSWSLSLIGAQGNIRLTANEALVNTFDPTVMTITIEGTPHQLTSDTTTATVTGSIIDINLNIADTTALKTPLLNNGAGITTTLASAITLEMVAGWSIDLSPIPNSAEAHVASTVATFTPPADDVSPRLASWDLNLINETLTLIFSESVDKTSITDITNFTITSTTGSTTLSDSTVNVTANSNTVIINLSSTDLASLIVSTNNTKVDTVLNIVAGYVTDIASNLAIEVTAESVNDFVPAVIDIIKPTLNNWTLSILGADAANAIANITLIMSESLSAFDVTGLRIQIGSNAEVLGVADAVTINGSQVNITLSQAEATILYSHLTFDSGGTVTTPVTDIILSAVAGWAIDDAIIPNTADAISTGVNPTSVNLPADIVAPTLQSWDLDLQNKLLSLYFNEAVDKSSLDVTALTISGTSLTVSSTVITGDNPVAVINLSDSDRDALTVATMNLKSNTTLSTTTPWISDISGNTATDLPATAVDNFTLNGNVSTTKPTLSEWTLTINNNSTVPSASATITMDKNISTIDLSKLTITVESIPVSLTNTDADSINESQISISFTDATALALFNALDIQQASGIVDTTKLDVTLTAAADWATDNSLLPNTADAITAGINPFILNVPSDTVKPSLSDWDLDLEVDKLTLTFSEIVDVSTIDLTFITIAGDTESHTLRDSTVTTTINSNVINIKLGTTDADELLEITGNTK